MPELAVAVLGPDQPGVIAALSEVLLADEGNLEDASMTILRGQFAMTLVVDVARSADDVAASLRPAAERLGLLISVRDAPSSAAAPVGASFVVTVHGADRPGIVAAVTRSVAEHGGNVTDLSTRLAGGMYVLVAEVDLDGPVDALAAELDELSRVLAVEARIRPAETDEL